jgi:hypothetical protein
MDPAHSQNPNHPPGMLEKNVTMLRDKIEETIHQYASGFDARRLLVPKRRPEMGSYSS